jgi:Holliday junction resolvase RusA-like endonuclease
MINQHIKGTPKAQPRVKAVNRGRHAGVYTPKTADDWKFTIKYELRSHKGKDLKSNFEVDLSFFFKRPKSHYGTGKNSAILKDSSPRRHTKKPDLDNLAKAVLDALTDINFWRDDSQITKLTIQKEWADILPEGMIITANPIE